MQVAAAAHVGSIRTRRWRLLRDRLLNHYRDLMVLAEGLATESGYQEAKKVPWEISRGTFTVPSVCPSTATTAPGKTAEETVEDGIGKNGTTVDTNTSSGKFAAAGMEEARLTQLLLAVETMGQAAFFHAAEEIERLTMQLSEAEEALLASTTPQPVLQRHVAAVETRAPKAMDFVYDVGMDMCRERVIDADELLDECTDRMQEAIDAWAQLYSLEEGRPIMLKLEEGALISHQEG